MRFLDWIPRYVWRMLLSHYVTNGMAVAFGLLLISGGVHLLFGADAAAAASVGVVVVIPPDQAAPRRGKFWQLLPAAVIGLPLFYCVQKLHAAPILLGLLLVPATFLAFLAAAWGRRGLPISISVMFAMVFSLAIPSDVDMATAGTTSFYFAIGAGLYLIYATLANVLLNGRYRNQIMADTLYALSGLMRTLANQFASAASPGYAGEKPLIAQSLRQQAALADQLQAARNILLESPRTVSRQRLAGMLMQVLEMRDHLLACELDIDALSEQPSISRELLSLRGVLESVARDIDTLGDALLLNRSPGVFDNQSTQLAKLGSLAEKAYDGGTESVPAAILLKGLASRVGHINEEALCLFSLARGEVEPDLAVVRAAWQMFVSPTTWSWLPVADIFRRDAPSLRHAIRASLAIATAYTISLAVPWGTHDYWILLTIVVVLRGSFAQTVERRNSRVLGTLAGCLLAGAILSARLPHVALLLVVTLAQALAHGFAVRRYLVTAVAATILGLVQANILSAGTSPIFDVLERLADTLLGVTIAWGFSYVLPTWERSQIPALIARTLLAQARHARIALGLGQFVAVDNEPELEWRLARREVYDSLSSLVQATQQSLAEPRAVRPPLEALGRLLAHSYQLLAQLTAVKTLLLLRRGRLDDDRIREPMDTAAASIETMLTGYPKPVVGVAVPSEIVAGIALPDPFVSDLSPWLLRRLVLATDVSTKLREEADLVVSTLANAEPQRRVQS